MIVYFSRNLKDRSLIQHSTRTDMTVTSDCRWCWKRCQFRPSAVVAGSRAVLAQPLDEHERSPLRCIFRRPSSHLCGSAGVTARRWGEIMEWQWESKLQFESHGKLKCLCDDVCMWSVGFQRWMRPAVILTLALRCTSPPQTCVPLQWSVCWSWEPTPLLGFVIFFMASNKANWNPAVFVSCSSIYCKPTFSW